MSPSHDADVFRFVGYRITKLDIDESSLGTSAGPIAAEITATFSAPHVGAEKSGKSVLEMSLQLDIAVKSAEASSPPQPAITIRLVAGLSFDGEFDEAAQQQFEQEKNFYFRSLYWLLRDQLMSATRSTKLRALPLPWDIRELGGSSNNEVAPHPNKAKAKTPAKKPTKKLAARGKK